MTHFKVIQMKNTDWIESEFLATSLIMFTAFSMQAPCLGINWFHISYTSIFTIFIKFLDLMRGMAHVKWIWRTSNCLRSNCLRCTRSNRINEPNIHQFRGLLKIGHFRQREKETIKKKRRLVLEREKRKEQQKKKHRGNKRQQMTSCNKSIVCAFV